MQSNEVVKWLDDQPRADDSSIQAIYSLTGDSKQRRKHHVARIGTGQRCGHNPQVASQHPSGSLRRQGGQIDGGGVLVEGPSAWHFECGSVGRSKLKLRHEVLSDRYTDRKSVKRHVQEPFYNK